MAANPSILLTILLASFLASSLIVSTSSARILAPKSTLLARLKLNETGKSSCWNSLFELQSCSGEIVLFFLNGETHLGPNCCNAISIIEKQCWPSMMGSLGITTEESDILRGFCDAAAAGAAAGSSVPAPPSPTLHECYHLPRLDP